MAWGVPKTNWEASDEPGASDVNRWESNAKYNYDTNKAIAATGTGTNITLTTDSNIELVDGLKLMFRAASNNNGSSTTVTVDGNAAKPLYKPGTTDAPNLKAGKAYTIWYHASGGCFFWQASAEGNALPSHVLEPYTFSNDDDTGIPGEMPNRGDVGTVTLDEQGDEYNLSEGYYSGGKIRAILSGLIASVIKAGTTVGGILGTFTADATATAGKILSGFSAYVNGQKVDGSMPNRAGDTAATAISRSGTTIKLRASQGYRDGSDDNVTHTDANDVAANIKKGVTIRGLTGTAVIAPPEFIYIAGFKMLAPSYKKSGTYAFAREGDGFYELGWDAGSSATSQYAQITFSTPIDVTNCSKLHAVGQVVRYSYGDATHEARIELNSEYYSGSGAGDRAGGVISLAIAAGGVDNLQSLNLTEKTGLYYLRLICRVTSSTYVSGAHNSMYVHYIVLR